jgi:type IV secretion system protein TrbL
MTRGKGRYTKNRIGWAALLFTALVVGYALDAHAEIQSHAVLDDVLGRYSTAASAWAKVITDAATWLFWTLATVSMVWTFGMLALRRADLGEFLAEFFRFSVFTGFYFWLLSNGPVFANSIFASMDQLAVRASGLNAELSPSGVMDVGFAIFRKAMENTSLWAPIDGTIGAGLAIGILLVLTIVAVNMLLLLITAWILAYAGVFFLGFGGSRWTSELSVNYFRTVIGVATQLFTMVLVVGIGKTFIDDYYQQMTASGIHLHDLAVMLVVGVVLLHLSSKLPATVSGIVTGAALQSGALGVESALSIASAGAALGAVAVSGGLSTGASMGGAAKALGTAVSAASQSVAASSNLLGSFGRSDTTAPGADRPRDDAFPSPFVPPAGTRPIERTNAAVRAAHIGVQAGVHLMRAAGSEIAAAAKDRISETVGAKLADAIQKRASDRASPGKVHEPREGDRA